MIHNLSVSTSVSPKRNRKNSIAMANKPRILKRKNKVNFQEIEGSIAEQRAYEFLIRELEAKNWMENMLAQKLDFNVSNLCEKLRDGVLLCYLAVIFAPTVIFKKQIRVPKIGSALNIMAIENYQLFLKALDSVDFPSIYNFEFTDMWEYKNVYKVIHCIHMLAHHLYAGEFSTIQIEDLLGTGIMFSQFDLEETKRQLSGLDANAIPSFFSSEYAVQDEAEDQEPAPLQEDMETPEVQGLDEDDKEWAMAENCVIVKGMENLNSAISGVEQSFILQARDLNMEDIKCGGENFTGYLISNNSSSKVKVPITVRDLNNGKYEFTYTATASGAYDMVVNLVNFIDENDNDLLPVPCACVNVQVEAGKAHAPSTIISGLGAESAVAGHSTTFQIELFDAFGNKCSSSVNTSLVKNSVQVFLKNNSSKSPENENIPVAVNEETMTASYSCPTSGSYELHVLVNGEPISNKPSTLLVKDAGVSDPSKCSLIPEEMAGINGTVLKAGQVLEFTIQAKDKHGNARQSGGEVFSLCDSKNGLNGNKVSVIDKNDGTYACKFEALYSGNHNLQVYLNDQVVSSIAPIQVTVQDSGFTDASMCTWKLVEGSGESNLSKDCSENLERLIAGVQYNAEIQPRDKFGNIRKEMNPQESFSMILVSNKTKEYTLVREVSARDLNQETGTLSIPFSVQEAGDYSMQLLWQESKETEASNMIGFPRSIKVLECGKTDPSRTICVADVEKNSKFSEDLKNANLIYDGFTTSYATMLACFTIETFDIYGNERMSGGDHVSVSLFNPKANVKVDNVTVTDSLNGKYEVHYVAEKSGLYQILVEINGTLIVTEQLPRDTPTLFVKPFSIKDIEDASLVDDHDLLHSMSHSLQNDENSEEVLAEEISKLRDSIVKQIRLNNQVEVNVKELDRKISLLAQNRAVIDSMLNSPRGIFALFARKNKRVATVIKEGIHVSSPWKDPKRMELYGKLFYLLQTNPYYFSQLLYIVPQERVDRFLETVILSLYGYAFSPREEFLLLKLYKQTLELEVSKSHRIGSFLTENPVLPKMVTSYARRGQGKDFLEHVLFTKLLKPILLDKQLNLDLAVAKVVKRNSSPLSRLPSDLVPFEKVMEDSNYNSQITGRVQQLTSCAESILMGIIENIDKIPFGIRWVCKQLDQLLIKKHPNCTENERATVIGYLAYYRFMNPAIISPDFFGLSSREVKINMVMRNNLVMISKVLTNLTNNVLFDKKSDAALAMLNDWIKVNRQVYVEQFIRTLIKVGEPDEVLGVNQYMELTQRKTPSITINWNEIFATHEVMIKYMNKLVPQQEDPMRQVLVELGPIIPEELPQDRNEDIALLLVPLKVVSQNEIEKERDTVTPEQLYESTKSYFRFVLKQLPLQRIGNSVLDTLEAVKKFLVEQHHVHLLADPALQQQLTMKIDFIEENLPRLHDAGLISKSDQYRKLLIDITHEIQNQQLIRQRQLKEVERLKNVLGTLQQHNQHMKEQIVQYEKYIDDCRVKNYKSAAKNQSAQQENDSGKEEKEGAAAKNVRRKKYTYRQLRDRGIIAEELQVPNVKSLSFVISMPEAGVCLVEAKLAIVTVKTLRIYVDELLDRQAKNIPQIEIEGVVLNVLETMHLINSKFAGNKK